MSQIETERDVIFDLLSQELLQLPSSQYQYDVVQMFKELELSDSALSSLAYGSSSDVTMTNQLEELRDKCRTEMARLKDLGDEKERLAKEVLSRVENRHILNNGSEWEMVADESQSFLLRDASSSEPAALKSTIDVARPKSNEKPQAKTTTSYNSSGVAPYVRDVWERVTGNYRDEKELPVDVEHLLLMFADKRRAQDQKSDPNTIPDTSGPPLAITFKPKYWKQFENTTGKTNMKNLRKDAVRERHQSTVVVDSKMTDTRERALSIKSTNKIHSQLASGQVLAFTDLLKSMPIFFHLSEEELKAFEAQCTVQEVKEDEVLLSEGTYMKAVYIIANGIVTMTRDKVAMSGAGGVPEIITTLSRGDFFGDCLPRSVSGDYKTKSGGKMKALGSFTSTLRKSTIYTCTGATFRRFAYRKNLHETDSEILQKLVGSNRVIDTTVQSMVINSARHRAALAARVVRDTLAGLSGKKKQQHEVKATHETEISSSDEISLTTYIEQYLEFSLVVKNEDYLREATATGFLTSANRQSDAAEAGATMLDKNKEPVRNKEGKPMRARASILGSPSNLLQSMKLFQSLDTDDGDSAPPGTEVGSVPAKRATIFKTSTSSVRQRNRDSALNRSSTFGRDFDIYERKATVDVSAPDSADAAAGGGEDGETSVNDGPEEVNYDLLRAQREEAEEEATKEMRRRLEEAKDLKHRLMKNVMSCTTPENTTKEVFDAMLSLIKDFFDVERVGLFIIDKVRGVMVLHRSVEEDELASKGDRSGTSGRPDKKEDKKGSVIGKDERYIEVPLVGVAGHIARSGSLINLADAHNSALFDRTMDDMTNFRTRQMLCVPCFDSSVSNNVVGVLQIINCKAQARPDLVDTGGVLAALREAVEEDGEAELGDGVTEAPSQTDSNDTGVEQVAFSKEDEILASIIAGQLGSAIKKIQSRPVTTLSSTTIGGTNFSIRVEQLLVILSNCDDPISKRNDRKIFPKTVKVEAAVFHGHRCLGKTAASMKVESEPLELDDLINAEVGVDERDRSQSAATDASAALVESTEGSSSKASVSYAYYIAQDLIFPETMLRDLPLASRLFLQFYGVKKQPVGWCVIDIFDFQRCLVTGTKDIVLWDGSYSSDALTFVSASTNDLGASSKAQQVHKVCTVHFKQYEGAVMYESVDVRRNMHGGNSRLADMVANMGADEKESFKVLGEIGNGRTCKVTMKLSVAEEDLIWKIRRGLVSKAQYLPAFTLAASWNISESVSTVYHQLGQWTLPNVAQQDDLSWYTLGLQLVQSWIADPKVRSFAVVELFKELREEDISGILMPLLVALDYERFFDSALIRYMCRNAISAPYSFGVSLYWHLRSEATDGARLGHKQRNSILSMIIMRHCGDRVRTLLGHTEYIHRKLASACRKVLLSEKDLNSKTGLALPNESVESIVGKENKSHVLRKELMKASLPESFSMSSNPVVRCNGINPTRSWIVKTFPRKSVRVAFRVDESKTAGGHGASDTSEGLNEAAVWVKIGVDPYFERVAVQMLQTMNLIWRVKGSKKAGTWSANKAGECVTTYRILSQMFDEAEARKPSEGGAENASAKGAISKIRYRSNMYEVPLHAVSFQELLVKHHDMYDLELKNSSSIVDNITFGQKPKSYTSLENREFPDDIIENWMCVHNFDVSSVNLQSYAPFQDKGTYGTSAKGVEYRRNASGISNYAKYNHKNPVKRPTIRGLPSLQMKSGRLAPNKLAREWRYNYARSLAYYYVSSLALGVGNRNTDNIFFLPDGQILNFEMNLFGIESSVTLHPQMTTSQAKASLKSLLGKESKVHLPSCFTRILGSRKGKLFQYFQQHAWEALLAARRGAGMLITVLKACLVSVPGINDGMTESDLQELCGIRGCLHPDVVEMICIQLRKNLYLNEDSNKWDDEESKAQNDFFRDLQTALGEGSHSYGESSYPVTSRFVNEEFSRDH